MRSNLPVSGREHPFPSGQNLVSITDLQGRITYCNPAFIEVSGFVREELLGQPHNLVRHPDMPEEAYRDLWATIASGQPWSAPVKNRRKNGDHYWVMANVTPLMDGNRPSGYMSVRTEATRAQIDAAERLYATMRTEKARGQYYHRLQRGDVHTRSLANRLHHVLHLGMGARLVLLCLLLLCAAFAAASVGGQTLTWGAILAWIGVAALTGGVALHAYHLTVRPLQHMVRLANRIAACDLTLNVRTDHRGALGEMEKALSQISVNLRSVVRDARVQSRQTLNAVSEVAQGNLDLSARTESQASQAAQLAGEATSVVQAGNDAVDSVAQTMDKIRASSARIGEITQLIDSIAFQTNILALNAAVEAARAGEQGRGFAVVASEVRSLAQRSADAAKEIRHLIDESSATVQEGLQKTGAAQKTMAQSLQLVGRVNTFMGEIHSASSEQMNGISQVNAAIAQLDQLTQHNAALVEEHSAATMAVQAQAQTVVATVQVFRLEAGEAATQPDAVALRRSMKAITASAAQ